MIEMYKNGIQFTSLSPVGAACYRENVNAIASDEGIDPQFLENTVIAPFLETLELPDNFGLAFDYGACEYVLDSSDPSLANGRLRNVKKCKLNDYLDYLNEIIKLLMMEDNRQMAKVFAEVQISYRQTILCEEIPNKQAKASAVIGALCGLPQ